MRSSVMWASYQCSAYNSGSNRVSVVGTATSLRAAPSGFQKPISVAERCKARVCGRSLAGITGSNPAGGMDVCVVCCK